MGWTKQQLASSIGVTPASISQYENGSNSPSKQVLAQIALVLGRPHTFFLLGRETVLASSDTAHFRSLRSTTQKERKMALAHASLAWELDQYVKKHVNIRQSSLPVAHVPTMASGEEIEDLAVECRKIFELGSGPIPHVVRLLESAGVLVVRLPVGSRKVDAFSCVLEGQPIVLLNDDKEDTGRSRHSAAHELGHLIAHEQVEPGSKVVERQADRFASALLMPADKIKEQFPRRINWKILIEMREYWGVSLASLIYRGRTLDLVSEHAYRRAFQTLNTRRHEDGTTWRKREPGNPGPPERPVVLQKALTLMDEHGISVEQISNDLCVPSGLITQISELDTRPAIDTIF